MKKFYFLLLSTISIFGFSQTILNQQETTARTVQDPNVVVLAQGFHATSSISNPFVAKIGESTDNSPNNPTDSQAGTNNPSGTTSPQGTSFHDTQGNIDVNSGGQLQFTLPIALPPGIKSVAPQINLVYTSGSVNGIAGYGWNISGITAITRIGKTIEKDGEVKGIQLDYSDYYSFNGQRLILKSGEYGKDGAEYATEKYSNIKIKSYGVSTVSTGPAYWEVTFEDGSQAWYGATPEGGYVSARTPIEYNIVKWKDAQGNYINYSYTQADNVAVISTIQWGGNETLNKSHFNEIQLTYTGRDLKEGSYVNGISFIQQRILTSITVNTNGNLFKKYEITYKKQGSNYQVVDYIKEKNSVNQEANAVVFENSLDTSVNNVFRQDSRYDDIYGDNIISGDFDADGRLDFYSEYRKNEDGSSTKISKMMFSRLETANVFHTFNVEGFLLNSGYSIVNNILENKSSIFSLQFNRESNAININEYVYDDSLIENKSKLIKSTNFISSTEFDQIFYPFPQPRLDFYINKIKNSKEGNFKGDGSTKIIALISNECAYEARIQTPHGTDWIRRFKEFSRHYLFFDTVTGVVKKIENLDPNLDIQIADFNGDGKSDILQVKDNQLNVYSLNNQNEFVKIFSTQKESLDSIVYIGDFNGDGKTDILAPIAQDSSDWRMYISTGNGFRKEYYSNLFLYQPSWQGPPRKNRNIARTYSTSDLNKDGKSDFVIFESQVWFRDGVTDWNNPDSSYGFNYLRNEGVDATGKPIFSNVYNIAPREGNYDGEDLNYSMYGEHYIPLFGNFRIAQLNTDFAIIHKTKLITWDLGSKLNKISRIKSITQGGLKTDIEYAPLTSTGNVYKSYYDTNPIQYPYANLTENVNYDVVSKLTQGLRKQEFRYRDFIGHLHGKGMIGFRQTARSTWYASGYENTKIWSGSEINPTNEGLPYKDWSIKTTDENSVFPTDISLNNSQLLSFKQYEYKIDKLLNGTVVTSYSDADKPKIVTAINPYITTSKDFQKDIKTVHTVVNYDNLYLPTKSTTDVNDGFAIIISEVAYNTPITTGANYSIGKPLWKKETIQAYGDSKGAKEEYDYTENLLTKKRTYDRNNSEYIEETYTYDGFGNIIQKKIENPYNNDNVQASITESQYDDKGRFVIKKTDNLGLETNIIYNNWGQILTQTDPLGNVLTNTYDAWGKLLTSKTNLGGTTTYAYEKLSNGDTKVTEYSPDNDQKITYTNNLGQNYKSSVKGISQGSFVSQEVQYDALGRKFRESEPYFEGSSASKWNTTEYDDYSRPIKVTAFTGKVIQTAFSTRTITATETNANNRFKTQVYDAIGNISSTTDKGGTINFKYNAAGENIEAKYGKNIVKTGYDNWGRKNFFYDPSNSKDEAHAYKYEYNGYGQLINTSSPKGEKYYFYNEKGQLTDQAEIGNDMFAGGIKQIKFEYTTKGLISKKYGTSNGKSYSSYVNYDTYGRVLSSGEESNGKYFLKKGITYDDKARVISYEKGMYSSGVYTKTVIENVYGSWGGDMYQLKDKNSGRILWELTEANAKGQVLNAKFGGTSIENTYDSNNFLSNVLHKNTVNTNTVLQLSYSFNAIKNELNGRTTGGSLNVLESFTYDDNNRLLNWTNPKTGQLSNNVYDVQGRITENDQIGTIKFANTTKIYQPTGFVPNDAGQQNYLNNLLQKVTYNENNDPVFLDGLNGDVAFEYGLNSMRQKVTYGGNFGAGNNGKYTKFYSEDGSYEIVLDNTTGKEKHIIYIGGSPYESNILYLKNYQESVASYKFLHKDYLGSILAISDEAGNILEQRHFDAWGNLTLFKINGIDQDVKHFNDLSLLDRGYTSHEHYTEVGIIHMNGRLYDPLLRRFLNADENIQDQHNTQVYNKYAYVINNPLLFNDPTGEVFGIDDVIIAVGVAVLFSAATDYYQNRPVDLGNMFQSVAMSIMSAGVANGIGDVFRVGGKVAQALGKTGTIIARAGAHAVTQGVFSYVQGGNFLSGALSGAFASAAGDLLKLAPKNSALGSPVGRFLTGAVVGGVGSKLAGGNFWQGAAIGAVVTVFNHFNHEEPPTDFNEDYYYDPETGYSYFKTSEYLYEVRDQSGKLIQEKYISQVAIKYKFADVRQQMEGYKILGNVLTGIGFAMTITGVGAPAGIVLMTLGGGINTVVAAINTTTYLAEKRYSKAGWEAGGEAASAITGGVAGKLIKPSKDLFRGYNSELGEQVISTFTGEVATPIIEQQVKTVY